MTTRYLAFFSTHWILTVTLILTIIAIFVLEMLNKAFGIKRLSPQAVVQLINQKDAVVIDIRNSVNFNQGHIINALNMMPNQVDQDLQKRLPDKNKPVIVVGEFEQTAITCARKIFKNGYSSVQILAGGLRAWQEAGLPLEKTT